MAVIQEAYVHGVSTRSVDDLIKAMGAGGMSKSQVSRLRGWATPCCGAVGITRRQRTSARAWRALGAGCMGRGQPRMPG